jgi:NADPH-dependent 7-cyano-7-deazaguanine reductase QueF-like protein
MLKSQISYDFIYDWTLLCYNPETMNRQKILLKKTMTRDQNVSRWALFEAETDEVEEVPIESIVQPINTSKRQTGKKCILF